jgi:succinate dehydrogenase / fumarate reductase flavoprotein subunit
MAPSDDRPEADAAPTPPARIREFLADLDYPELKLDPWTPRAHPRLDGAPGEFDELDDELSVTEDEVEQAIEELMAPLERDEGPGPFDLHEELQDVMDEGAQMLRQEEGLEWAIEQLEDLAEQAEQVSVDGSTSYNPGWHRAVHLPNMILTAQAVARAALMREESRGAHLRTDFPDYDDETWGDVNIVIRNEDDDMELVTEPAPERPEEIQEIIDADPEEISSDSYGVKEVMP